MTTPRTKFIAVRASDEERSRWSEIFQAHGLELSAEIRAFLERKAKRLEKETRQ